MPNRQLSDSVWTSPNLNRLSPLAERHFYRLLPLPDDFGCFEATPAAIRGRCYPLRQDAANGSIMGWHAELEREGLCRFWADGERIYGQFVSWAKFQRIRSLHRRKTPEPPKADDSQWLSLNSPQSAAIVADCRLSPSPIPSPSPSPAPALSHDADVETSACASGQKPEPPAGKPSKPNLRSPEVKAVLDWFYGLWAKVNGKPFPVKSQPYTKEAEAAVRLLADYPDHTVLTQLLEDALRGRYFAKVPACLAQFKPANYTKANRKDGNGTESAKPKLKQSLCPFNSPAFKACEGSEDSRCRGCPKHGDTKRVELPGADRKRTADGGLTSIGEVVKSVTGGKP